MATYTITYFDFPGGRGEDCRLALHIAGADFEDDRVQGKVWSERKSGTPFGVLPVLEVEGKGILSQSNTILRYLGRELGMHPTDDWDAGRHESIMGAVEDLRSTINPTSSIKNEDEKRRAREALADGYIKRWASNVEAFIGDGPFVAGDELNVVDLKLFVVMKWIIGGGLDHIPTNVFEPFAKLTRLHAAVNDHPKVVEWYAKS